LPILFRGGNIPSLRAFVPAAKQDDQNVSVLSEINPVSRAKIQPKFHNPFAHRPAVAEITKADPVEPDADSGARLQIPQRMKPFAKRIAIRVGQVLPNLPFFYVI
jgi:hypothetical protein